MDRFQILKGIQPRPLTAKERLDAEALRIFQNAVDKIDIHKLLTEAVFAQKERGQINRVYYNSENAMNRFQILKGQEPPAKQNDNSLLVPVDGKVIGKIQSWHPGLFPEEALAILMASGIIE